MFTKWKVICTVLFMSILLTACNTDSTELSKNEVSTVDAKAEQDEQTEHRLITTTASLTAIMAELDLDLVGISETKEKVAERYEGLPTVGGAMDPDEEKILSLKPTEVFAVTTLKSDLEEPFKAYNINARFVDLQGVDNMFKTIKEIGADYDRVEEAENLVSGIEAQIAEMQKKIEGKEQPRVLILLGIPGSYLVASENSYIGDLVKKAGGINVVEGDNQPEYLASNTEYLHQGNPDVILRLAHGWPEKVVEMFDEEFVKNDIWKHFNAVKNGRVYDLDEPVFGTTANLHITTAFEQLIDILYGEGTAQ